MRLRVAKKVAKRHASGARYRQPTLDRASTRLKLAERLVAHPGPPNWSTAQEHYQTGPNEEVPAGPDYTTMSVAALKALAKEQGRKGYSKLKKAELIELLG